MKTKSSLAILAPLAATAFAGFLSVSTIEAQAICSPGDFICEKFNRRSKAAPKHKARHQKRKLSSHKRRAKKPTAPNLAKVAKADPASASPALASLPTAPIPQTPAAFVKTLQPGAITTAPLNLANLAFGSGERIEIASAQCRAVEQSRKRVMCSVAVHQLTLTGTEGAGCTGSLGLRQLEFAKSETGNWVNEDSIELCGGRLLRRTELFPVALNGQPLYALREEYQMLGGDHTCAAPYLQNRKPLRRAYLPTASSEASSTIALACGKVALR